jgi:hypothetical protein
MYTIPAWSTADEKRFLDGLARGGKFRALWGYVRAARQFVRDWGPINGEACVEHAEELLALVGGALVAGAEAALAKKR